MKWTKENCKCLYLKIPDNIYPSCAPSLLGVFKEATEKLGPVDVLINNAGIGGHTTDDYDRMVAVNMVSIPSNLT